MVVVGCQYQANAAGDRSRGVKKNTKNNDRMAYGVIESEMSAMQKGSI